MILYSVKQTLKDRAEKTEKNPNHTQPAKVNLSNSPSQSGAEKGQKEEEVPRNRVEKRKRKKEGHTVELSELVSHKRHRKSMKGENAKEMRARIEQK